MKKFLGILACAVIAVAVAMPASAVNSLGTPSATAALNGTNYGLPVNNDLSSNDVYVASEEPAGEAIYRFSFYLYPGTLDSPMTVKGYLIGFAKSTTGTQKWFHPIFLRRQNAYWTLQTNLRQDDNSFAPWQTAVKICGDSGTAIPCSAYTNGVKFELEFVASSGPGANDGTLKVYKSGVLKKTFSGLDTDLRLVDEIRWGAIFQGNAANRPPGSGGTYYFDEFESYRTVAP